MTFGLKLTILVHINIVKEPERSSKRIHHMYFENDTLAVTNLNHSIVEEMFRSDILLNGHVQIAPQNAVAQIVHLAQENSLEMLNGAKTIHRDSQLHIFK